MFDIDPSDQSRIRDRMPTTDSEWGRFLSPPRKRGGYERNWRLMLRESLGRYWDRDVLDEDSTVEMPRQLAGAAYISMDPWGRNAKFLRVEFSPYAAGDNGRARLQRFLLELFGDDYERYLRSAKVNRVDVGFDVYRMPVKDILAIELPNKRVKGRQTPGSRLFVGKDGEIESIYTPLTKSRYLVLYDKTKEINHRRSRQGPRFAKLVGSKTRIEYRWTDLGMPLLDIDSTLENPFVRFDVRKFPSSDGRLSNWEDRLFFDALRTRRHGALSKELVENCRAYDRGRLLLALSSKLERYPAPAWWDPELIWRGFAEAIRETGLYPTSNRVPRLSRIRRS